MFFFSSIRLPGPAYSAGLIGKDVAPAAAVKCQFTPPSEERGREREEKEEEEVVVGGVKPSWPFPSVPGRPGRSVCGRRARGGSGRATLSWRRSQEEARRDAIWSGGASGM